MPYDNGGLSNRAAYPPQGLAWAVWGCGAALYLLGFFQRVAPAVMTEELARDFSLTAAGLGNLSAYYFYSYVAMQIPTGVLADRLGPRRLLTAGAFLAAAGSVLFGAAQGQTLAGLGRLLIGGSVAVAFVGMLKLASNWFPPRQFSLASGMALFCGIIGAVFAGVPLGLLVAELGWRPVMVGAGIVTGVVCVVIWLIVRDDPTERGYLSHATGAEGGEGQGSILGGIKEVFRYGNTWLLTLAPGGIVGAVLTFSGLWGIPFLTTVYGMERTRAASVSSALLVAWAVGGPVLGAVSDRLGRRKLLYALCNVVALGCWAAVVLIEGLDERVLVGLLLIIGFVSGGMIIGFAFAKESVPARLSGTVSGVVNMGVMIGPMILQPAIGKILDHYWAGGESGGVRLYSWSAYRAGFSLMLAWVALSVVMLFLTRETHGKPQT